VDISQGPEKHKFNRFAATMRLAIAFHNASWLELSQKRLQLQDVPDVPPGWPVLVMLQERLVDTDSLGNTTFAQC